jgi:hypothetical protein
MELVGLGTGVIPLRPKIKGTNDYLLTDGAVLYFTLREVKNSPILLEKQVTDFEDGWGIITIESSDTESIQDGTYICDLVCIRADGTRDTLIPEGRDSLYFVIKRGVKQGQ